MGARPPELGVAALAGLGPSTEGWSFRVTDRWAPVGKCFFACTASGRGPGRAWSPTYRLPRGAARTLEASRRASGTHVGDPQDMIGGPRRAARRRGPAGRGKGRVGPLRRLPRYGLTDLTDRGGRTGPPFEYSVRSMVDPLAPGRQRLCMRARNLYMGRVEKMLC